MKRFALVLVLVAACATPQATPTQTPQQSTAPEAHAHGHAGGSDEHRHHGGGMHHRFEDAEAWAKVFDDPARDAWQQPERVVAALELAPSMTVADIGAGTGYFTVRLARAVPAGRVIANDVEPDMVRYMKARAAREGLANIEVVQGLPDDPKLPSGAVDRVLVVDVWHHLGDRVAYAKQLAAALRAGGRIAVVDFKLDAKLGPPKQHRLAPDAIVADLRAAGLSAEVLPVSLPEQYIVMGQRR